MIRTVPTAYRITDKQVAFHNSLVAQIDAFAQDTYSFRAITEHRSAFMTRKDGSLEIADCLKVLALLKAGKN